MENIKEGIISRIRVAFSGEAVNGYKETAASDLEYSLEGYFRDMNVTPEVVQSGDRISAVVNVTGIAGGSNIEEIVSELSTNLAKDKVPVNGTLHGTSSQTNVDRYSTDYETTIPPKGPRRTRKPRRRRRSLRRRASVQKREVTESYVWVGFSGSIVPGYEKTAARALKQGFENAFLQNSDLKVTARVSAWRGRISVAVKIVGGDLESIGNIKKIVEGLRTYLMDNPVPVNGTLYGTITITDSDQYSTDFESTVPPPKEVVIPGEEDIQEELEAIQGDIQGFGMGDCPTLAKYLERCDEIIEVATGDELKLAKKIRKLIIDTAASHCGFSGTVSSYQSELDGWPTPTQLSKIESGLESIIASTWESSVKSAAEKALRFAQDQSAAYVRLAKLDEELADLLPVPFSGADCEALALQITELDGIAKDFGGTLNSRAEKGASYRRTLQSTHCG